MYITLEQSIEFLQKGDVIAIPTDTVYGLAADMQNKTAIDNIFSIKKRPNHKPLITLIGDISQMSPFIDVWPPNLESLIQHFWPGGLTLIIPIKPNSMLDNITAGQENAGFRMPNHPLTLQLLKTFGPVVAPSANLSTYPAATHAQKVVEDFGDNFPVLDGGPCQIGIASTILIYQGGCWNVSRPGAVPLEEISHILGYLPKSV